MRTMRSRRNEASPQALLPEMLDYALNDLRVEETKPLRRRCSLDTRTLGLALRTSKKRSLSAGVAPSKLAGLRRALTGSRRNEASPQAFFSGDSRRWTSKKRSLSAGVAPKHRGATPDSALSVEETKPLRRRCSHPILAGDGSRYRSKKRSLSAGVAP